VTVEWEDYQKCPVCFAELGKPCWDVEGFINTGEVVSVEADKPHTGRKLRAGR
jgi:hypothetical protein